MKRNDIMECPYCGFKCLASILSDQNRFKEAFANINSEFETFNDHNIQCQILYCANFDCAKSSLWISYFDRKGKEQEVRLVPKSSAKPLPEYIPKGLREDYEEACLILEDSPKASAALARRCLQGMIRDYWGVKKGNLFKEIKAIEKKIEPNLYAALLGIKDIGNVGSHPQSIVGVDKHDAYNVVSLLESLFKLWYVSRHTINEEMSAVSQRAQCKKQEEEMSHADDTTS